VLLAAAVVVLVLAGLAVAGVMPSSSHKSTTAVAASASSSDPTTAGKHAKTTHHRASSITQAASAITTLSTSCRTVVHIGDSTSEGLTSSTYLPDPAQRIGAQYRRVGVKHAHFAISGATSVVETLPGTTNSYDAAKGLLAKGVRGCWVIALGTNDTADVHAGSNVGLSARIARMMSLIGDEPVMWVNVRSLVSSGPYAEPHMQQWNRALVQACLNHANMRIYDWASAVKHGWFTSDGIHFTSAGYASRAHLIANALAKAFPADGVASSGCLVTTKSLSIRARGT
jgi:GDSL-like Lipase/Acylhydrolase family